MIAHIPFIGGPLDGHEEEFFTVPVGNADYVYQEHSYEFDFSQWQYTYKGKWQTIDALGHTIRFRTYRELLFYLGVLMAKGEITAQESLQIQRDVVARNSLSFMKYEASDGNQSNL